MNGYVLTARLCICQLAKLLSDSENVLCGVFTVHQQPGTSVNGGGGTHWHRCWLMDDAGVTCTESHLMLLSIVANWLIAVPSVPLRGGGNKNWAGEPSLFEPKWNRSRPAYFICLPVLEQGGKVNNKHVYFVTATFNKSSCRYSDGRGRSFPYLKYQRGIFEIIVNRHSAVSA